MYMDYDIQDTERRMKNILADQNLKSEMDDSPEDKMEKKNKKIEIRLKYNALIQDKVQLIKEYREDSKIHRNLR